MTERRERPPAICPSCGTAGPAGARFCAGCGTRIESPTCESCGSDLVPGGRFCPFCGISVDGSPAVGATPDAPPPLRTAEMDRIGTAERRLVSVLFVDLVDFTSMAETMDPEEVRTVQSRYFEVARSIVASHGGTIEKFVGDAVMAVWGAPSAHEDDAERAVRAALSVVWAVDRIGGAASGGTLRARAAVTTGEAAVTVGAVDQGIVTGDLVNIAARLQGRAPAGGVIVDRATRDAASTSGVPFSRLGSLALKGRTGRLETFRAVGLPDGPTARSTSHTGRLVGRERELREITDLVEAVIAERRCRLVSVTGIAGSGKSRLVFELDRWVDAHPLLIHWHEGRALAYGEGVAFAAVAQMVRRRAHIADDAAPELARRQLDAALEELVRDEAERGWLGPRLATLIDGDEGGTFDRDELFAAWRRFFERVAERSPAVLVFEDLHWADPSLLDFIEHLAAWSRDRPIFILTLARPELLDRRPTWGAGVGSFTGINLGPLADEAMRALLAERAPGLRDAVVEQVLHEAGGVPLYAVEVARMLTDRDQPDGSTTRGAAGGMRQVPDSLHGVIAARLDALPPGERRLLMAAAVLGHRFRPETLLAIVDGDPAQLRDRLDGLVRREMLVVDDELGSPGRGQLVFVQDLVREVAYGTLAHSERRTLHLAVARHLESLDDDLPEQLAAHLAAAHRLTTQPREADRIARRAVSALRRAARAATTLHVPSRAAEHLEAALELADAATRPALLADAADAARAAGRLEVAEARLRELIGLQQADGRKSDAARSRAQLASVMLTGQANEPALQELEAAIRDVRSWRTDPAGLELAAQLARARSVLGHDRQALRWAEEALAAAERLGVVAVATDLLITRGTARISLGQHEDGMADLRTAIDRAEEGGVPRTELRARNNLAWALLADDPVAAFATARQGLELAAELGLADFAVPLADLATAAAIEAGDWDWALETIADLEERGVTQAYGILLSATVATIQALRGDPAPLAVLDRYEPLPEGTDGQVVALGRLARAWAAFLAGDLAGARSLARQGIAGAAGAIQHHDRELATRICLWMGDVAQATAELAELRSAASWGRAAEATVLTMEAGLAAISGDQAARSRFRVAREAWSQLELPLQLALCLLDERRLTDGDDDPTELLAICERLGADGLLRLVEAGARRSSA